MKKTIAQLAAIVICVAMAFSFATVAMAEGGSYADVSQNAWYAEAVAALREKRLL